MNIQIDTNHSSNNQSPPARQIPQSNSHARSKANMTKPIAFIIGAGQNIGASTAKVLRSKGYRIALAARSLKPEDSTSETLHLTLDLSKPESVGPAFASLRKQWGEPSVVFYNGEHHVESDISLPCSSIDINPQPPPPTLPPPPTPSPPPSPTSPTTSQ